MKRFFIPFVASIIAVFSSIGCTLGYPKVQSYQEEIQSFYTNEEKSTLLLIGKKYHYLFVNQEEKISDFLQAEKLLGYNPEDLELTLTRRVNQNISIQFHLKFSVDTLNSEQTTWLETHGFYRTERKDGTRLNHYSGGLFFEGTRYKTDKKIDNKAVKLDKALTVKVLELDSSNSDLNATLLKLNDDIFEINGQIVEPMFTQQG